MSHFEILKRIAILSILLLASCKPGENSNSSNGGLGKEGGDPVMCPMIGCAAPPEKCHYEGTTHSPEGCLVSCGNLVCDECPIPECAAPPEGCNYAGPPQVVDGCPVGCGQLVCEREICPMYPCAAPPEGCNYLPSGVDDFGCALGCGTIVCPID